MDVWAAVRALDIPGRLAHADHPGVMGEMARLLGCAAWEVGEAVSGGAGRRAEEGDVAAATAALEKGALFVRRLLSMLHLQEDDSDNDTDIHGDTTAVVR